MYSIKKNEVKQDEEVMTGVCGPTRKKMQGKDEGIE